MDLLQEHLTHARASGGVFARSAATPPWGLRLPGDIQLAVHAVIRGRAWIWSGGSTDSLELRSGDLALVKGGADHFIAHEPGAEVVSHDAFAGLHSDATEPADTSTTVFLCGAYRFRGDIGQGLVSALPPILRIPASADDPIHAVVELISQEMMGEEAGKQTALDRLLDILVLYGLRTGLTQASTPPPWLRAAAEPRLSAALEAIHSDPATAWTVERLAARCTMSRATFARTFRTAVGQSPIQYLYDWRMALARDHLGSGDMPLAEIAQRVGFSSVYAFSAAFRRTHGEAPGRWRQNARARYSA